MLLLGIIGMLLGVAVIIAGCMVFGQTGETNTALLAGSIILGVLLIVGFILELCGLRVLNPNEAPFKLLFNLLNCIILSNSIPNNVADLLL